MEKFGILLIQTGCEYASAHTVVQQPVPGHGILGRKRPASKVVGHAAGLVFAAKAGGVGSAASGLVADAVEGAVSSLAERAVGAAQAASRLGSAVVAYVAKGVRTLRKC